MKQNDHLKQTIPDHAFRSIGLADAELMLVKSELHSAVKKAILAQGWSQKVAGEKLGWGQPDISKIMNDRFSQHSVERLLKAALDLGLLVSFGIAVPSRKAEAGRIALVERGPAVAPARKTAAKRALSARGKRHPRTARLPAHHAAAE
jgi:predicted XRE-type DNA-binding protein